MARPVSSYSSIPFCSQHLTSLSIYMPKLTLAERISLAQTMKTESVPVAEGRRSYAMQQ